MVAGKQSAATPSRLLPNPPPVGIRSRVVAKGARKNLQAHETGRGETPDALGRGYNAPLPLSFEAFVTTWLNFGLVLISVCSPGESFVSI